MEKELSGRYITYQMITPLLDKYPFDEVIYLGSSVKGIPINLYRVGKGNKKILLWSQMHGNESTTTKALFDVLLRLQTINILSRLISLLEFALVIYFLNPKIILTKIFI